MKLGMRCYDPTPEQFVETMANNPVSRMVTDVTRLCDQFSAFGGAWLYGKLLAQLMAGQCNKPLPHYATEIMTISQDVCWSTARGVRACAREWEGTVAACHKVAHLRATRTLPAVPLTVISQGRTGNASSQKLQDQLQTFHQDMATLSPLGKHRISYISGHIIPIDDPEIIVESVREVVEQVRSAVR